MKSPNGISSENYAFELCGKVKAALKEAFPGECREGFDIKLDGVSKRPFSLVLFLSVVNGTNGLRLVAKKPLPHKDIKAIVEGANQAAVEYSILGELYPLFSGVDGCGVPRPVLLLEDEETLVIERVEGCDLNYACRGARFWNDDVSFFTVREAYRNCGRWLGNFQSFTGISYEPPEVLDSLGARLRFKLGRLMSCGHSAANPALEKCILDAFSKHTGLLKKAGMKLPVSGRHGDYGGWNILVANTGVTVIDFLGYERDLAALDFVKMLVTTSEKKHRLLYTRSRVDKLIYSFIQGYGEPPETPTGVFFLCELYYRTAGALGLIEQKHFRPDRRIDRANILSSHLEWLRTSPEQIFSWGKEMEAALAPAPQSRQSLN